MPLPPRLPARPPFAEPPAPLLAIVRAVARAIEGEIKRDLGLTARLTLLPFASFERTEGKTRHVIRTPAA